MGIGHLTDEDLERIKENLVEVMLTKNRIMKGLEMSTIKLYEYAILKQPLLDDNDQVTEKGELLKRGEVLAAEPGHAQILVSQEIPKEYLEDLGRITLVVRPF